MTTSLLNAWRYSNASRATRMHASGSSPFTWKIGGCTMRATSVQYSDERDELGEVEGLGDDALTGERRVAVHEQRQHGVRGAAVQHVLLGAGDALEHGVDG